MLRFSRSFGKAGKKESNDCYHFEMIIKMLWSKISFINNQSIRRKEIQNFEIIPQNFQTTQCFAIDPSRNLKDGKHRQIEREREREERTRGRGRRRSTNFMLLFCCWLNYLILWYPKNFPFTLPFFLSLALSPLFCNALKSLHFGEAKNTSHSPFILLHFNNWFSIQFFTILLFNFY